MLHGCMEGTGMRTTAWVNLRSALGRRGFSAITTTGPQAPHSVCPGHRPCANCVLRWGGGSFDSCAAQGAVEVSAWSSETCGGWMLWSIWGDRPFGQGCCWDLVVKHKTRRSRMGGLESGELVAAMHEPCETTLGGAGIFWGPWTGVPGKGDPGGRRICAGEEG